MLIGVPKEIKDHEYRVSVTPDGVRLLRTSGHQVLVEPSAGQGSGFTDEAYRQAGAQVVRDKEDVFRQADLIVKVKEPQLSECVLFPAWPSALYVLASGILARFDEGAHRVTDYRYCL